MAVRTQNVRTLRSTEKNEQKKATKTEERERERERGKKIDDSLPQRARDVSHLHKKAHLFDIVIDLMPPTAEPTAPLLLLYIHRVVAAKLATGLRWVWKVNKRHTNVTFYK